MLVSKKLIFEIKTNSHKIGGWTITVDLDGSILRYATIGGLYREDEGLLGSKKSGLSMDSDLIIRLDVSKCVGAANEKHPFIEQLPLLAQQLLFFECSLFLE